MRLFYELLAEVVESVGLRAYLPHRVSDPVTAPHLEPRAVYDIDRAHVTSARVVVAYAGILRSASASKSSSPASTLSLSCWSSSATHRLAPAARKSAVVEVVRFGDLVGAPRACGGARSTHRERSWSRAADRLGRRGRPTLLARREARHLPNGEIAALLRIGELDGEAASTIRERWPPGVSSGGSAGLIGPTPSEERTSACSCCGMAGAVARRHRPVLGLTVVPRASGGEREISSRPCP